MYIENVDGLNKDMKLKPKVQKKTVYFKGYNMAYDKFIYYNP